MEIRSKCLSNFIINKHFRIVFSKEKLYCYLFRNGDIFWTDKALQIDENIFLLCDYNDLVNRSQISREFKWDYNFNITNRIPFGFFLDESEFDKYDDFAFLSTKEFNLLVGDMASYKAIQLQKKIDFDLEELYNEFENYKHRININKAYLKLLSKEGYKSLREDFCLTDKGIIKELNDTFISKNPGNLYTVAAVLNSITKNLYKKISDSLIKLSRFCYSDVKTNII